jgi:sugar-specific transcriptional regulator TrmB
MYEVLQKLIDKGLVSVTTKNNIQHFDAASPTKIQEYLKRKKHEIIATEKKVEKIIPNLTKIKQTKYSEPEISVFYGWEGFSTVIQEELNKSKKNTKVYIIGASTGQNTTRTERFFIKHSKTAIQKGLDIKVIFNTEAKNYVNKIEKNIGKKYDKKYLFTKTPTEITIIDDTTLITILHKEPTVIKIVNKETSNSFRQYFSVLWQQAQN